MIAPSVAVAVPVRTSIAGSRPASDQRLSASDARRLPPGAFQLIPIRKAAPKA
jgi:hypothetical protein